MVINTREDKVKWNTVLADYIEYWCEEKSKKSDDLPYHLQQANLYSRYIKAITLTCLANLKHTCQVSRF